MKPEIISRKKEWTALRFSPYYNDPKRLVAEYKTRGWAVSGLRYVPKKLVPAYLPDYKIHNTVSRFLGAIQVEGTFLIHGGPETPQASRWGAAGCVEVIGNFDTFRQEIVKLSGFSDVDVKDVNAAMKQIVDAHALYVEYQLANPPDLRAAFDSEVNPWW